MKSILTFLQRMVSQKAAAILLLTGVLAAGSGTAYAVSVNDFVALAFTNAQGVLPYRLFIPTNYSAGERFPLVLFLHGAGERGNDNAYQLVGQTGSLVFASETNQLEHPSFMVAPQCPTSGSWDDSIRRQQLFGLMNLLISQYSIDTNRLYITGLSMGGYGTWDQITQFTNMYAAAIPMSSGGNTALAARIVNLPIWNFHAADDSVVDVSGSRGMISAVRRAAGNPIYTEYAIGGHAIWTPAYNTPILMGWVYSQQRGVLSTSEPLLSITVPTADAIWRTGDTNLNSAGTAGALGQSVTTVSWTNFANNVKGIATGSNLWNIASIPLQASKTNIVAVVATTTSWVPAYGGRTTFNDTLIVIQAPIRATLTMQGVEAILNWTGGAPPYRVQRATDLVTGNWTDYLTDATPPLHLSPAGPAEFYRIIGQ